MRSTFFSFLHIFFAAFLLTSSAALAGPRFGQIDPPDGQLMDAREVWLEGEIADAARLVIDGEEVAVTAGRFKAGPYPLSEGDRVFVLVAEDAAGERTERLHKVTRDSRGPAILVSRPARGVVAASPVAVSGTAVDPHLIEVTVGGRPAALNGVRFEASVPLDEGAGTVVIEARDRAGNVSRQELRLTLDTTPPAVDVRMDGRPLTDGAVYARPVRPEVLADEGNVEVRLDGARFEPGREVTGEGPHTLTVRATDEAGHTSVVELGFEVDLTPPSFGPHPKSQTVASPKHTVSGQVFGATEVRVNGRPAKLAGTGYTASVDLAAGENTVLVEARDAAGHTAATTLTVKVDTTGPALTVGSPPDGSVVASSPITVAGTVTDEGTVTEVKIGAAVGTVTGDQFTIPGVALAEGSNSLTVEATDDAANTSQAVHTVVLDTIPPAVQILANGTPIADSSVFPGLVTPVIQVTDATDVDVASTLDSLPWTSNTSVTTAGSHVLEATATDAAGHSATASVTFTVEASAPVFETVAPADGTVLSAAQVTLMGRASGAVELTVDGVDVPLVGSDFVSGPHDLAADAERTFTLVATSPGGQTTTVSHRVTGDVTGPALAVTSPADGDVVAASPIDVTGTVSDTHLDRVSVNGTEATVTSGTFQVSGFALVEGDNLLRVRAVDQAGNATEVERTVALDTRAPEVAITDPAPGTVVGEAAYTLSGTVRDPHLDRVEMGGEAAQLTGESWTATATLTEGMNDVVVEAWDTLGNRGTASVEIISEAGTPDVAITSPAAGFRTASATVDVAGTVDVELGGGGEVLTVVTVNGEAATVAAEGTFSATAIPLATGENRLVSRATDTENRQGVHVRIVERDVEGPTYVSSQPVEGAFSLPPSTVFEVTFSEPLAEPAVGAWILRRSDSTVLGSSAAVEGEVLTVTPSPALPESTAVELELTAALTDEVGNALVDPRTLTFTTGDTSAGPSAPVITTPPPAYVCAHAWTLQGTAGPSYSVRVEGGGSTAESRADAQGAFSLTVALQPDRLHRLTVTATDLDHRTSPSAIFDVVQDCTPPLVASAERQGDDIVVTFSEPVDGSTVTSAVTVSSAGAPLAGSVSSSGATATFNPSSTPPAGPLRLEVSQAVTDLAGNALEYPYSTIVGEAPEESFLSGTVIDDATGRPLRGARVVVTATDGAATADPQPEQTTGADGRFLIPVPAGTHDVTIARPGYTPVFRIATTSTGEGTELFAPRLTPASETESVGTSGGTVTVEGGATLDVPSGALAAATDVTLTPVSEQGLAALLPYGWSPRGAVWLDVEGDLLAPATLTFPAESQDGILLTVAELDLATLQWTSLGEVSVTDGQVSVAVQALGAYAALEADAGALAPPAPITGEVLGSSPTPTGSLVATATVSFDPEVVLPTQTSLATVTYTLDEDVASGLPLTLVIQEELTLLDGTVRREAPYRADLVLYKTTAGAPRSRFRLQPSVTARTTPIQLGGEDVVVVRYADESVRGNVLGPEGGSVLGDQGDRLDVPAGSLTQPTAIVITRQTVADLPIAAPAGGTVDGVVELDLGGTVLASPGRLTLAMATPPSAGEVGLLLQVVDVGGTPRYRAVAELEPSASGWTTTAIDPADLPWPGVTSGGQYVFVHLTGPHAFVRGTARRVDGTPLVGGIVSSDSVDWIQLTDAEGRYVLPVPTGTVTLDITNPENANTVAHEVTTSNSDERADLDTQVEIVAPIVVSTTPTDGATVPAGLQPTVTFSEPVDPSTVADGIRLVNDEGQEIELAFDVQGVLVHVLPLVNLVPGSGYQLRLGFGVKDLQGYGLAFPVTVSFTTQEVVLPAEIDASKIFLYEPDAAGDARVVGDPGAVPSDHLIWVENLTSYSSTVSTNALSDGSFEISIGASITDDLLFHVLVPGANEVFFELGPFMSEDRRSAWADHEAVEFTTADDITVTVEAETFEAPTRLTVAARAQGVSPSPAPVNLTEVFGFDLDLGGAQPKKPLELRVPAPAGAQQDWYLVARSMELLGQSVWSLKDILVLDNGYLTADRSVPAKGLQKAVSEKDGEALDPRDYEVGVVTAGSFSVFSGNNPMAWLIAPVIAGSVVFSDQFANLIVEAADALDYVAGWHQLAVPTLLGQDFKLQARDLRSGYGIFSQDMSAPIEEVVELPEAFWPDQAPPYPTAGSPLAFHFLTPTPGEHDVAQGVRMSVTANEGANSDLTLTFSQGSIELGAAQSIEVKLLSFADGLTSTHPIDAAIDSSDVTISRQVPPGSPVLLTIGPAEVRLDDWIEIAWSEALPMALPGFELYLVDPDQPSSPAKRIDSLRTEPVGTYATIRLRPEAGWRSGESYRLRLTSALTDVQGNGWLSPIDGSGCSAGPEQSCTQTHFDLTFEIAETRTFEGFDFQVVRDVARLGNLLFVAAGQQGLWVLDATDPNNLRNYLSRSDGGTPINTDLSYTFPLADQIQGLAIDPHGRVIVVGGGLTGFGQLKILDPLEIDPAALTDGDPENRRFEAFRGSTLLSNPASGGGGIQGLQPGKPRRVELRSWDKVDGWSVGAPLPEEIADKLTVTETARPNEPGVFDVTVSGTNAVPELPVTLRNTTRRSWDRLDAGPDGAFQFQVEARRGERLELVRHVDLIAYVVIEGVGLAAVDVNHFYGELEDADGDGQPDFDRNNIQSQVLRYYDELDPALPLAGALCTTAPSIPFDPTRALVLHDFSQEQDQPLTLLTLVGSYGLVSWEALNANEPVDLSFAEGVCGTGSARMVDMALVQRYPVTLTHQDGTESPGTRRDYVVMTTTDGRVLVVDVSDRHAPFLAAAIQLPPVEHGQETFAATARGVTINREQRLLYVSAAEGGVRVLDFNGPFPDQAVDPAAASIDEDLDGLDDRLVETLEVFDQGKPILVLEPVELWPDLSLAWIGGLRDVASSKGGMSGFSFGPPRMRIVAADEVGTDGRFQTAPSLAPFGVPTAPIGRDLPDLPGLIRVEASLPSSVADAAGRMTLDLVSLGPGGLEIQGAGNSSIPNLPPTSLSGGDGLILERMADDPWEDGYNVFVSEPVVLLADLRASHWYEMTDQEKNAKDSNGDPLCRRCDLVAEEVYPASGVQPGDVYKEVLSGHSVAVRWPSAMAASLESVYDAVLARAALVEVASVPWDISPSVMQEPANNPSYGMGEVVPGTLLHSGEFSRDETDMTLPGIGFDFVFARTYRSQTVGAGPLGPGWDHGYRMRLRLLPNGDAEFFDGRGRRETFRWQGNRFKEPPGRFATLGRFATGYTLTDRDGNQLQFDPAGRLIFIQNVLNIKEEEGSLLKLGYDQESRLVAVSGHGRGLSFEYDTINQIDKVHDDTGRTFDYDYDGDDRLITVKSPTVKLKKGGGPQQLVTQYTYEDTGGGLARLLNRRDNLDTITDPKGFKWLDLTYAGGEGDLGLVLQTQMLGDGTMYGSVGFLFTDEGESRKVTVTDRRGNEHVYHHNPEGHVTSYTDPETHVTTWKYGAYSDVEHGLPTEMTLPSGRKAVYQYAEAAKTAGERKPATSLPNLAAVKDLPHFDFPEFGLPVLFSDCEFAAWMNGSGPEIRWIYENHHPRTHRPRKVTTPGNQVLEYDLDASQSAGHSKSTFGTQLEDGAESTQWLRADFELDPPGRVERLTTTRSDGAPEEVELHYLRFGEADTNLLTKRILRPGGPNERITEYDPHPRGYLNSVTEPGGVHHTFEFNALGWLLEECHDTQGANPANVCTLYRYDQKGQVLEIERPFGRDGTESTKVVYKYYGLGELEMTTTEVKPGGPTLVETRTYDQNLNLLTVDVTGRSQVRFKYDKRNLLTDSWQLKGSPDEIHEHYEYNVDGQATHFTDGRGNVWSTYYDQYGRPIMSVDPLGRHQRTIYDASGRPRTHQVCDENGGRVASTDRVYDAANRLLLEERWDFSGVDSDGTLGGITGLLRTRYVYDSRSNLSKVIDPALNVRQNYYDAYGRHYGVAVNSGQDYLLEVVEFDDRDRPIRFEEKTLTVGTNPTSFFSSVKYDGLDRVVEMEDGLAGKTSYKYDKQDNLVEVTLPDDFKTTYEYDALGRMTLARRPHGIEITRQYLPDSQAKTSKVVFTDGLGQQTVYDFDGAGRLDLVTYPDTTTEDFEYDGAGNPDEVTHTDGTFVQQAFDGANQLKTRTITLAAGLAGHTQESYDYDGLGRLKSATHGTSSTVLGYDKLSRKVSDTTGGRTVGYRYDAFDHSALSYPSSVDVDRHWGGIGQLETLTAQTAQEPMGNLADAEYRWLGQRIGIKRVGFLIGNMVYDAAQRLDSTAYSYGGDLRLGEDLKRDARGWMTGQIRTDFNRAGWDLGYDQAGRLLSADWTGFDENGAPDASEQRRTSRPAFASFEYDEADNLERVQEELACEERVIDMPLDGTGRNRPDSVGGVVLAWDDGGRLVQKGDLLFVYDARDRLVEVKRDAGGTLETVATYGYDGLDRRVERTFDGHTWRTVWSDWQPIEEYEVLADETERLISRRVYGVGLDEMVTYEYRLPGQAELTRYKPIYDAVGNLAVMLDADGDPVERYDYTPYGKRFIWVDSTPPSVEQVRLENGVVFVELSEEVREDVLRPTLNQELVLENLTQGGSIPLTLELPVTQGRRARHRLELTLDVPIESLPGEGDSLRLTIPGAGLEDLFGNRASSDPDPVVLTWSSSGLDVPVDTTRPRLVEACVKGGKLRLVFSEPTSPANAMVQLSLDGVEEDASWTVLPDGYTVEHPLTAGAHVVEFDTGPFDLSGKALEATPPSLTIPDNTDQQLLSTGFPGEVATLPGLRAPQSTIGNPFGFHGLPVDEETGLVYVRNRYYDPELGRFLQTDPYGYADSANLYQFALNDPVNKSDPTGLCVVDYAWDAASIGLGYWSFQRNLEEENFGAAIWDAVGITVDSVALAVPCAPGGLGIATKAARAVRGVQGLIGVVDVGQALHQGAVAYGQKEYDAALLNALLGAVGAYFGGREFGANFGGLFSAKVAGAGSGGFPVRTGIRAGSSPGSGGAGRVSEVARTPDSPRRQINLLNPANPKFGDDDLVYGPFKATLRGRLSLATFNPTRQLQQRAGGRLLTDFDKPVDLDWYQFSVLRMEKTLQRGNTIHFDLTYLSDLNNALIGRGLFANSITVRELRYLEDNWDRFQKNVTFYRLTREVTAPWVGN